MVDYREVLRLYGQGISQRNIAVSCACSRHTVSAVLEKAEELKIDWSLVDNLSNGDLQQIMFPTKGQQASRRLPDCAEIHKELAKSGVTLSLLWNEYCESCRLAGEIPLMYTQFCNHYRKFAVVTKATMHIDRKPGEQMEVDWAGQTASLVDRDTGEISPAHIFVAALSSSQYAYVEATLSQDLESWILAHVHAFVSVKRTPHSIRALNDVVW